MRNYGLEFITDENLFSHIKKTVLGYSFEIDLKSFNSNLIDPIKLTFDSIVYGQDIEKTIENEVLRQLDKSNSNLIGYFHQNIFNYIGDDWNVPTQGYDVECSNKKIYVEMKNKHNTMNSSSGAKTYMKMLHTLVKDNQSVCLLVEVIASKSQNIPWVITLDGVKQSTNNNIRRVSIDKFYELVTGDKFAFKKLCEVIPKVIDDVIKEIKLSEKKNTVFIELNKISDNTLKSLYLLAFDKYEGFDNLNL
ncbi:MAG: hypothetical protein ACI9FW_001291 [Flavobacterium sp.]|jgi:hypothetical protein